MVEDVLARLKRILVVSMHVNSPATIMAGSSERAE
jgi:hypothetical protein